MEAVSLVAITIIVVAIAVAASGRFLAVGALLLANIAVHLLVSFGTRVEFVTARGVFQIPAIHADLSLHGDKIAAFEPIAFLQLLTHMFVHADLWHLAGNVIILLAFALPFEERVGHRAFLALYLSTGLVAALVQSAWSWGDPILMMGASGAVFGIIGAFAASYPNLVVPLPLPLGIIMIFVRMRVVVAAAVFGVLQMVLTYLSQYNPGDNVAYFAHLGGLAAGIVLGWTLVRRRRREEAARVPTRLDLQGLDRFARDDATRNVHTKVLASRDEPDVLEAWLERFFLSATCPTCEGGVALHRSEVVCTHGHRFDVKA